jgi:hypothetical protein
MMATKKKSTTKVIDANPFGNGCFTLLLAILVIGFVAVIFV